LALQADGWWLRSEIIYYKTNGMPESVKDRPTNAHEHVFLLSKSSHYYYDSEAIKEPTKESTLERYKRGLGDDVKYKKRDDSVSIRHKKVSILILLNTGK